MNKKYTVVVVWGLKDVQFYRFGLFEMAKKIQEHAKRSGFHAVILDPDGEKIED